MNNRINAWYQKKQLIKKKVSFAQLTEAQRKVYWENLKKLSEVGSGICLEGTKIDRG
jgi:hypothetical protein